MQWPIAQKAYCLARSKKSAAWGKPFSWEHWFVITWSWSLSFYKFPMWTSEELSDYLELKLTVRKEEKLSRFFGKVKKEFIFFKILWSSNNWSTGSPLTINDPLYRRREDGSLQASFVVMVMAPFLKCCSVGVTRRAATELRLVGLNRFQKVNWLTSSLAFYYAFSFSDSLMNS